MRIKRSLLTGAAAVFIILLLTGLIIMHGRNMKASDLENALYIEKDKLKDDMIYLESLLENDHSIVHLENGDYIYEQEQLFSPVYHRELIEHLSHDMGIEVAIYIKEDDNYHCITSSIVNSDGSPAIDIFLGDKSAAYASIQSGLDFTGKDVILGSDYLTLYRPLFQPDTNEVMGILFTGIKIEAVKNIISRKSNELAMRIMLIRICAIVLGTILIIILFTILARIIAEKNMAEMRLRVIFDAMPLGANVHGKDFKFLDCNESAVKMFGLSNKREYLDNFHLLSPEYQPDGRLSRERMNEKIDMAFAEGFCRFEWTHQKLNGEPLPCEVTLVRVKHKNDYILTAYMRDLRDLKVAIIQKNESEQSLNILKNILNGLDAMIYVTVPETGEILFINDYMKKIFNIKDDCVGQFCYKLFMIDANKKCDFCPCNLLDERPESVVVWERENPLTKRIHHNTDRYIEWQNGRIVHIQHSVDMTDLIMAKEQAEQSSRFKSQFLSRMSHEVRTPMNAILGITEIQLQDQAMPPDKREALEKIFNSGYLLLGIINDILDLSKIEAGKLELSPAGYDVPNLINDTVQLTVAQYDYKPVEFSLQLDENIPLTLFGDELRIKQILNNLLSNAFKYTDKGGVSLSVNAERPGHKDSPRVMLVFRVADTGHGMTREQVERLFDEYSRFNMEANRTTEGTGLGMSITKQLVRLMNGEISVESEIGKGSAFTVRLPQEVIGSGVLGRELAEKVKQLNAGGKSQTNNAPQFVREYMPYGRVLVVDDVETNLYVARGLMAPYGLSIEIAASGFEVIEKIKSGATFDIIFMDHFMPKMDGMETTKKLRGLGYTMPIIALTANALIGQAEMFLENGFDGFISKPIDIRQLNASLNKFIRDKYPSELVEMARRQAAKVNTAKSSAVSATPSSGSELAAIFTRDAEKALASMKAAISNGFREKDDFTQYVINAHSMKSALANIGETGLSDFALRLELAGRAEKVSVIISETPPFLEELDKVIKRNKLKEDGGAEKGDKDGDSAYLTDKLRIIKTACGKSDGESANTALSDLRQKNWPNYTNDLLDTIEDYLSHNDFEEAVKLIEDYETIIMKQL